MSLTKSLTRVQVYLNPEDVSLLDELAKQIRVTRSQIIRDATNAVAMRYAQIADFLAKKISKKNPLCELAGFEKSKTGRVGLDIDQIYLHD